MVFRWRLITTSASSSSGNRSAGAEGAARFLEPALWLLALDGEPCGRRLEGVVLLRFSDRGAVEKENMWVLEGDLVVVVVVVAIL